MRYEQPHCAAVRQLCGSQRVHRVRQSRVRSPREASVQPIDLEGGPADIAGLDKSGNQDSFWLRCRLDSGMSSDEVAVTYPAASQNEWRCLYRPPVFAGNANTKAK